IQQLTELFYSYRQFPQAIEFAKKCKNYPNAEKIIGLCSFEQEDYPTAVSTLQSFLAKNPKDAQAIYTIGRSYLEMEEYKKAVPFYKQAVEADPSKNAWAYELGLLSYNNDDFKTAAVYFTKAADNGYNRSN